MRKPKPARIAYVRWFDSCITTGEAFAVADTNGVAEMESCGLVVAEDAKSITVALDRGRDTGNLRCAICIPKVNVRAVKRFRA